MKAKNFLMIVFLAISVTVLMSCGEIGKGPTDPDPPKPPDNSKYYDLEVEYTRPEILSPEFAVDTPLVYLFSPEGGNVYQLFTRIDDYHFKGEFLHVKAGLSSYYYFHLKDRARYNGSDESSAMVGDIFKVKVKQITGPIKELRDIRPYTLSTNPCPGPLARAAFFVLTKEGVIISD